MKQGEGAQGLKRGVGQVDSFRHEDQLECSRSHLGFGEEVVEGVVHHDGHFGFVDQTYPLCHFCCRDPCLRICLDLARRLWIT